MTAQRKADELVADRKRMADEFNSFRMRMVSLGGMGELETAKR